MASVKYRRDLRKLVAALQLKYFTTYPVKVRFMSMAEKEWGDCCPMAEDTPRAHFLIRINSDRDPDVQFLVLVHEYAHAMQWRSAKQEAGRANDHDAEWGVKLAEIWEFCCQFYEEL